MLRIGPKINATNFLIREEPSLMFSEARDQRVPGSNRKNKAVFSNSSDETWMPPKAKFRRRTSHEPNRMQMRKILCSPSLAFDSAHVKYGV